MGVLQEPCAIRLLLGAQQRHRFVYARVRRIPGRPEILQTYEDVAAVLKDPRVSSKRPTADEVIPASLASIAEHMRELRTFQGRWMMYLDPPEHTRLRALVSKSFTASTWRSSSSSISKRGFHSVRSPTLTVRYHREQRPLFATRGMMLYRVRHPRLALWNWWANSRRTREGVLRRQRFNQARRYGGGSVEGCSGGHSNALFCANSSPAPAVRRERSQARVLA